MSCPSWQWHRTGSRWSPVRTLQVAPLWCDLGFFPNSRGNEAAANLRPKNEVPSNARKIVSEIPIQTLTYSGYSFLWAWSNAASKTFAFRDAMQRQCYRTRNSSSLEKSSYCEEGDTVLRLDQQMQKIGSRLWFPKKHKIIFTSLNLLDQL